MRKKPPLVKTLSLSRKKGDSQFWQALNNYAHSGSDVLLIHLDTNNIAIVVVVVVVIIIINVVVVAAVIIIITITITITIP